MNNPVFRLIIAGGREFVDYKLLTQKCEQLLARKRLTHTVIVLCGMQRGADILGKKWAEENGFEVLKFPANWNNLGLKAGPKRNKQMVDIADAALFFWDGSSTGTGGCINLARNKGIPIKIVSY